MPTVQEHALNLGCRSPRREEEPAAAILPASFEDGEEGGGGLEPLVTSLESLDEGQDDEEGEDFFQLDNPVEEADEDEEDDIFDNEDRGGLMAVCHALYLCDGWGVGGVVTTHSTIGVFV